MPFRQLTLTLLAALVTLASTRADKIDDALNKIGVYADGIAALAQNKNEVAAINLRKIDTSKLTIPAKIRLLTRIAEAEVRAENFEAALALFEEPGLASDPQANYWRAIALLGSDAASEAEKILAEITQLPDHPHWPEATLTRTSLLLRFGALEEAIKILTPLVQSGKEPFASEAGLRAAEIRLNQEQWNDVATLLDELKSPDSLPVAQLKYIRARLSLGKGDWSAALFQLQELNSPSVLATLPPNMRDGATISLANALRKSGSNEEAASLMQSFIDSHPESPNLKNAFDTLDGIGIFKANNINERLVNWANSPTRHLAAIATYYLAVAQTTAVNEDAAATTLETIRSDFKDHPVAERALLDLSEIYVATANKPQALAVLADLKTITKNPAILSRIAFIEARADYAVGDFKLAADKFADAADAANAANTDESATAIATYNSAVAALKTGDIDSFKQRTQLLTSLGETEAASSLLLERSLFNARLKSPDAVDQLNKFLTENPEHQRRAEAHLALAYLQLNLNFPVTARKHIEKARKAPMGAKLSQEAEYIAFWIEVGDHQNTTAIEFGERFIKRYPASARAPEILFKLGGMHFRDSSFTLAQTNFEQLALQYPTSPRAEIALFTAGRAAMRTGTEASIKRSISLFAEVAAMGGEFATSAELQRALVHRTQLNEEKALPILDNILKSKPTGEVLFSTLITKGESLDVLGEKDPARLAQAITVFDSIARHPEVDTYWRNQALTRKGNSLERADRTNEALA
ncbi:MAG: TolA-binding protein, partial [Verrucomicrobiales bacterium]